MTEQHKASPEMQKFFTKLLDLKKYVAEKCQENPNDAILKEIYKRLDATIKSTEEKK